MPGFCKYGNNGVIFGLANYDDLVMIIIYIVTEGAQNTDTKIKLVDLRVVLTI